MADKILLSVALLSFNEEKRIARTLDSVKNIATEIITVDSHSTDRTLEIATQYGVKCYTEDWKGFIGQRNSSIEKCSGDWILCLDCDEVLTPELQKEILDIIQSGKAADAYNISRKSVYLGKALNHAWMPDFKLRLFKKSAKPKSGGYEPHDVISVNGKIGKLQNCMLHYSYDSLADHYTRLIKYAKASAESYQKMGKKFKLSKLIFNPLNAFCKEYLIKRGFLDGMHGLSAAVSLSFYTFLKYLFLWDLTKNKR